MRWFGMAAVLALTAACSGGQPAPQTVRVDRGTVATAVSASGTLVSISEQRLGFDEAGKIVELPVKVGDRVEQGQVLARIDDFSVQQALEQARAGLAQQQAVLDRLKGDYSQEGARNTLAQARDILDATKKQVAATNQSNAVAVDRARKQLDFDRKVLEKEKDELEDIERRCGDSSSTNTTPTNDSSSTCDDQIANQKEQVESAKRTVIQSETSLKTAEEQKRVDEAAGRVSIENAEQSVVSAQNDVNTAKNDNPAQIREQEAVVRDAQAQLRIAEQDVENTILRAPVPGVVSAINGVVGELIDPATGATAQSPDSAAALPLESGSGGENGGGSSAPGSGALIVLNNVDTFQMVVPFEESDASQVAEGREVQVSVDALPDARLAGTVLGIAPSGDSEGGVVRYYTTIMLTQADPRLRDGQTALADIVTESVENTLRVPSVAVRQEGGRSVVDVVEEGQTRPIPFEPGLIGDEYTQVISGLRDGQELSLPQANPAAAQGGGGPGGGG
jgi:HlyD family secretion protein